MATYSCETWGFPPTQLLWHKNGAPVIVDNVCYSTEQTVTNRETSAFRNVLLVHDVRELFGDPVYRCTISSGFRTPVSADIHEGPLGNTHTYIF